MFTKFPLFIYLVRKIWFSHDTVSQSWLSEILHDIWKPLSNITTKKIYLPKITLHITQSIVISQWTGLVIHIVNWKFQFLNHLKVVVHHNSFSKIWIKVILDFFSPSILKWKDKKERNKNVQHSKDINAFRW